MNHWLKIVSIAELDPQAACMLNIRLPILSKNIHYDVRWASCYNLLPCTL